MAIVGYKGKKTVKVMIVEDSPVYQKILRNILNETDEFEVVAIASNGLEAIKFTSIYNPDVISMDILMPVMDGIEATKQIMQSKPVPIVIVSNIYQTNDTDMAIKELEAGAVYILPKPSGPADPNHTKDAVRYRNTLRLMSEIKVVKRIERTFDRKPVTLYQKKCAIPNDVKIIAIGASAGGPEGIRIILSNLSEWIKVPVVIVQHIDPHFIDGFISWLNNHSAKTVKRAENGEFLLPETVYVAPGGKHIQITKAGVISLVEEIKSNGHIPSIDNLFESVNKAYGGESIAILLSGMGRDGADGLKQLNDSGCLTFVQNEESSLVFGMPNEAIKLGAACRIMSPEDITNEINNLFNRYGSRTKQ
jgi:two-component system, chemotaxis family, protein-glutamate methylesterase/glutaminase